MSQINMIASEFIYSLGQIALGSSKKTGRKDPKKVFEDNQIVEEYEGECEKCEREVQAKICPMCEG